MIFTKAIKKFNEKPSNNEQNQSPILKKSLENKESKQSRLEFDSWIIALSMISGRLYSNKDHDNALLTLLDNFIMPVYKKEFQEESGEGVMSQMIGVLQDEEITEFMGKIHKIMLNYYYCYSDSKGLMNYKMFLNFCKEFSIFPDLCNKTNLHRTFYALAFIRNKVVEPSSVISQNTSKDPSKSDQEFLDDKLFIEALALSALQSKAFDKECKPFEKMMHLMEKVMQSPGIISVKKKLGKTRITNEQIDPLIQLKMAYPDYFSKKFVKNEPLQFNDFFEGDDLLSKNLYGNK